MKSLKGKIRGPLLLLCPLLVVSLTNEVPKFVYAACSYYTNCNQSSFTLAATPAIIAINETSFLEAQGAACPCSWAIDSQPGGWQLVVGSSCTATLKPTGSQTYGNPGEIVVRCNSQTCTKTVKVIAGSPSLRIQVSTNRGVSWTSNEKWIYGHPGDQIDVSLRVLMTATADVVDGWSYSLQSQPAAVRSAGGDLDFLSAAVSGTHTATAQAGYACDFQNSQLREDAQSWSLGFTQGVVVDYQQVSHVAPVFNFVTVGACFRIVFPSSGTYSVPLTFTDDIGDAHPPIRTAVIEDGQSRVPCQRNFTLRLYSSTSTTPTASTCDSAVTWVLSGDGSAGPQPPGGGGGGVGEPGVSAPPVFMADANDDAKVDLADAVFVMRHLFQGGQEPARVNTTRVLKTGQVLCFDDFEAKESCEEATQAGFFGQDAHYRDTVGASREYVLEQDLDQDGVQEGVKDLRTGLMWERRPERITNSVGGTTFDLADGNAKIAELNANAGTQAGLEGFNNWRRPTIGELMSALDYSRIDRQIPFPNPQGSAVPVIFSWNEEANWSINQHILSSTNYPNEFKPGSEFEDRQWRINRSLGHNGHSADDDPGKGLVAVREFKSLDPRLQSGPEAQKNRELVLGDFDADGVLNLTDAVNILSFLFLAGSPPHVYTVRPITPEAIVAGRFALNQAQTIVSDDLTGLEWHQRPIDFLEPDGTPNSVGVVNWQSALQNAEANLLGEHADWRLPNVFELNTLANYSATSTPAMAAEFTAFSNGECADLIDQDPSANLSCTYPYWSSTTAISDHAYQFYPNSEVDPEPSGIAAGSVRCERVNANQNLGRKLEVVGWVLPVRGPVSE